MQLTICLHGRFYEWKEKSEQFMSNIIDVISKTKEDRSCLIYSVVISKVMVDKNRLNLHTKELVG